MAYKKCLTPTPKRHLTAYKKCLTPTPKRLLVGRYLPPVVGVISCSHGLAPPMFSGKGAFTLGVKDSSIKSPNTKLVI